MERLDIGQDYTFLLPSQGFLKVLLRFPRPDKTNREVHKARKGS